MSTTTNHAREAFRAYFLERIRTEPLQTLEMLAARIASPVATLQKGPRTLVTISLDSDITEALRRYSAELQDAQAETYGDARHA